MTWKPTLFSELAEFRNGLNFIKNDNGRTIKIIGVSDFKDYIELKSLDTLEQITIKGELKSEDLLQDDDLLFVRSNGNKKLIGRCMIIKVGNQEISYSGFTIRARLKSKEVLPRFLVQLFRSVYIKDQIQSVGGGTNISNLSQSILGDLKIPLPPLLEQCRIAEVLGVWDESIDLLEKLIGRVRSRKQGLMQQLLTGKKRFKEFEGSEWKTVKLGDVSKFIRDGTHGTHERLEDGIPLLSATNITKSGQVCFDDASLISKEDYDKIHAKYEIQDRDFLLTVVGTLGRSAIVENLPKFTLQRSVAIVRVDESKIKPIYLYCVSKSSEFQIQLKNRANITAQAGVYLGELAKIDLKLPSLPEQEKIATVLSAADEEISTLEKQLAAYKQQKLGLMQQLLTGRIRI
jgi:type I restriction enzyme, S subunit